MCAAARHWKRRRNQLNTRLQQQHPQSTSTVISHQPNTAQCIRTSAHSRSAMADDTRPHEAPGQGREEHDASLVALTQQVHATSLAAAEAPAPGKIRGGGSSIAEQDDDDASHDSGHSPPQSSSQDTHHGHARQHHVFTPTTVATTTTTPSSGSVAPASSQATSGTATHQQPLPTPTATSSSGIGSPAPNHPAPEAQPTGAPPHFVAPSSYLRPVSRAAATAAAPPTTSSSQAVGSPTAGSRPGTERARNQMLSPLDREQIEGLVSLTTTLLLITLIPANRAEKCSV